MDGGYGSQRAPLENGDESSHNPIYKRSSSLKILTVSPLPNSRITWIRKEKVRKGTLPIDIMMRRVASTTLYLELLQLGVRSSTPYLSQSIQKIHQITVNDKVEEAFNAVEIIAKTDELVDIQRLRLLSSEDSAYTFEISHMEDNLKELSSETL
ncbi:hypothetical protein Cgig2_020656 [Carnegiea gigantea]|uniref:Uncharacterized protein n=1 Tax=Carnegiea gigantea TaxID=171969 RepID=A0A9Q1KHH2_9CARY|nr:hypothetical protein Cgig2_020656 [Carnegiea gigantea]